ncbi:MAG: hypothetical protein H8F28_25705 [Fibrella sp.]|nr:hypothetical protein [Armatimonadota bacterium]
MTGSKVVERLKTTRQHPFFVDGKGWLPAGGLAIGNAIVTRAGPRLFVKSIKWLRRAEGYAVYNFEVEALSSKASDGEHTHSYFVGKASGGAWVHNGHYDIARYGQKQPPFEIHHGVMDVWARFNIPGYIRRASDGPGIVLTATEHAATKGAYNSWTAGRVRPIDWTRVSGREAQELSEVMFDAAGVPSWARKNYYKAFHKYIYGL